MLEPLFYNSTQNNSHTLGDIDFKILHSLFKFHVILLDMSCNPARPTDDYPKCFKYLSSHLGGDE